MNFIILINLSLLFSFSKCDSKYSSGNNSVHQFRKQVEEIEDDTPKNSNDDFTNLFSLLINHVKDFFGDENIKNYNNFTKNTLATNINTKATIVSTTTTPLKTTVEVVITYETTTTTPTPTRTQFIDEDDEEEAISTKKHETENNHSKYLSSPKKKPKGPSPKFMPMADSDDQENFNDVPDEPDRAMPAIQYLNETEEEATTELMSYLAKSPSVIEMRKENEFDNVTKEMKASLSCIKCNNVDLVECYDPLNKLVLSVICDDNEDLCYSTHTPFGIIDRGCFNVRRFLSTYVCACNLCNYVPISEMPVVFSRKSDWIDNVFELSRTRRFKDSIFKSMLCLRCEVNVTAESGSKNKMENVNCLEGNVGTLPTQECKPDEICAVRAIRRYGYIWRGCVSQPLFNYWWTFCDSDLCNYDPLVTIYDDTSDGF